jgi:hypothetical protein
MALDRQTGRPVRFQKGQDRLLLHEVPGPFLLFFTGSHELKDLVLDSGRQGLGRGKGGKEGWFALPFSALRGCRIFMPVLQQDLNQEGHAGVIPAGGE